MKSVFSACGLILLMTPVLAQNHHASRAGLVQKSSAVAESAKSTDVVAGEVTLANSQPAAGAQVYLHWFSDQGKPQTKVIAADVTGHFLGSIPKLSKNNVWVKATAVLPGQGIGWAFGHRPAANQILSSGKTTKSFDKLHLRLQPGTALTGRLIRADGSPVKNIRLSVAAITIPIPVSANLEAPDEAPEGSQSLQADSPGDRQVPVETIIASQFHTQSDARGRFVLTGLPFGAQVSLKLDAGLLLASCGTGPIAVRTSERQDIGLLAVVQPGRIQVHITDKLTKKPLNGVAAALNFGDVFADFMSFMQEERLEGSDLQGTGQSNAQGDITFGNLRPGDYTLRVEGRNIRVRVDEGTAAPLQLALRQGRLNGRLLDSHGNPLANIPVSVLNGTPHRLASNSQFAGDEIDPNAPGSHQSARTGTDGSFTLTGIPWGSDAITIRAVRGNDLAEWTGSPESLGTSLTLNMHADALITVSGRLIDSNRKPLTSVKCMTLHWLESPRSTWFATAHPVTTDAQGQFRVSGLERGESFSLITAQDNRASETAKPFESPRFTTASATQEQNLGEVMVHGVQNPDEILRIYSDTDPVQQASLSGFLLSPAPENVQSARQTLYRYHEALNTGDLETLRKLTSRLSPGWSEDRRSFVTHCALTSPGEMDPRALENVQALNMVPRTACALLLRFHSEGTVTSGNEDVNFAVREMDANPNFVFLVERRQKSVELAGVLHKEGGAWRVYSVPGAVTQLAAQFLFGESSGISGRKDWEDIARVEPPLESGAREEAQDVAMKYLRFWEQNRTASMLGLTSPVSMLYSKDIEQHKQRLLLRTDEGICPVTDIANTALQPVDNLTVWDHKMLTQLSDMEESQLVGRERFLNRRLQMELPAQDPASFARRGDMALFRYSAAGQSYLMILLRYDGTWTVYEPALPL